MGSLMPKSNVNIFSDRTVVPPFVTDLIINCLNHRTYTNTILYDDRAVNSFHTNQQKQLYITSQ